MIENMLDDAHSLEVFATKVRDMNLHYEKILASREDLHSFWIAQIPAAFRIAQESLLILGELIQKLNVQLGKGGENG